MRFEYNGRARESEGRLSVLDFIQREKLEPRGLAVAVNEQIVPRERWSAYQIQEGDRVEIFNMVGGGR